MLSDAHTRPRNRELEEKNKKKKDQKKTFTAAIVAGSAPASGSSAAAKGGNSSMCRASSFAFSPLTRFWGGIRSLICLFHISPAISVFRSEN